MSLRLVPAAVFADNHFPSAAHPIELRNIAAVRLIANRRAGRPLVPADLQTDSPPHECSVEDP